MGAVLSPERTAPPRDRGAAARGWEPSPLVVFVLSALLLAFFAGMAWISRTAGVTHSNDDALYMLLGDQVAHFSYREEFKIGAPRHGQYPPLWPALLAVTQSLTGGSEVARFALATVLMTAALALFFDLCRRLMPQWMALAMLAAAACNPFTIISGGRVMSEAAFTFWTMLSLWALERSGRAQGDDPRLRRYLVLTGAAALAAALTRSIGVTLVGAILVSWAIERRWRPAIILSAVTMVALGGWLAWTLLHHEGVVGRSYVADAALVTPVNPAESGSSNAVIALAQKVAGRVRMHLTDMIPSGLPLPSRAGTVVDNVAWLVLTVGLGLLGVVGAWRRAPALVMYPVFYFGLLTLWPWSPRRFFVPVQPVVLLLLVLGALELGRRYARAAGRGLAVALLAIVVAAGLPKALATASELRRCDRDAPWTSEGCYDADQQAFFSIVTFARDSLPPTARFLVEREASFAYHAHRLVQHAQAPLGFPDDDFIAFLRQHEIGYVVLTNLTLAERGPLRRKLQRTCDRLEVVRLFPPSGHLYRVLDREAPPASSACDDLRRTFGDRP